MGVPCYFLVREEYGTGLHGVQEPFLINEWNEDNGFPFLLFAVEVRLKVDGIVVSDGGVFIDHKTLGREGGREGRREGGRE